MARVIFGLQDLTDLRTCEACIPEDIQEILRLAQVRSLLGFLQDGFRVRKSRACRALRFERSLWRYRDVPDGQAALGKRSPRRP